MIIDAPDQVVLGARSRQNRPNVAYMKRAGDGSVLYFEEMRTGRKHLAALTLRKYPATMNAEAIVSTLHPNAQSDGGIVLRILPGPGSRQTLSSQNAAPAPSNASQLKAMPLPAADHDVEASSSPEREHAAGVAYVGMYQSAGAPAQPAPFAIGGQTYDSKAPAEPIRREHIMAELATYGKENLFTKDEVTALIAKGQQGPKSAEIRRYVDGEV